MSTLELAAELAQLDAAQRQRLLAELPAEHRDTLLRLIRDMQPVAQQSPGAFAQLMEEMAGRHATATPYRDAATLERVLTGESSALRHRLIDWFAHRRGTPPTDHVATLVAAFIDERAGRLPAAARSGKPATAPRWFRFKLPGFTTPWK